MMHASTFRHVFLTPFSLFRTRLHSQEKSQLDKDVAERDLKQALDEAARKQRQHDRLAEMHATNSAQLQAKAEAKVRSKQEEAVRAEEWTHRLKELKQEVRAGFCGGGRVLVV
jgi:hypothetical protein